MDFIKIGTLIDRTDQFFEYRRGRAGRFRNENDMFGSHSNSSDNGVESLLNGMPKSDNKTDIEMAQLKSAPDFFKLFEDVYEEEESLFKRCNPFISK